MRVFGRTSLLACLVIAGVHPSLADDTRPPTREEVAGLMGLASRGDRVRGQRDTIGFVVNAAQAEEVIGRAIADEGSDPQGVEPGGGTDPGEGFLGGVCPHDDHLYAARVYVHLTERITSPRVLLIGVFHKARLWNLENRIVFDSFEAWHGPWGPVEVDALRDELLESLPSEAVVVDNAMHEMEHSLEAIVPFLQHRNRDVTIVPILAPYMDWERLSTLSDQLAEALAGAVERRGWKLGKDVAIVVSSDALHYGEDFGHAPFGVDERAYTRAVERDVRLTESHLVGALESTRLRDLLHELVDPRDVRRYRIPWCGRFSVPFGLEVLRKTAERLGESPPSGRLLRYGTSLSEAEVGVSEATREAGLGYTAPSNFHHWVGYAAIGYR